MPPEPNSPKRERFTRVTARMWTIKFHFAMVVLMAAAIYAFRRSTLTGDGGRSDDATPDD